MTALPGPARIEQLIDDNWPDAADSPRALRARVRALTAQLAAARDALTAEQQENEILREQLTQARMQVAFVMEVTS